MADAIRHNLCFSFPYIEVCGKRVELGFLVDGSESIDTPHPGNFKKSLGFVRNITETFRISDEEVRVGLVVFSTDVKTVFPFNKYHDIEGIQQAIESVWYPSAGTLLGKGLMGVKRDLFGYARPGVPRILVVLTDGKSRDKVEEPAKILRAMGVHVVAVGVGPFLDRGQLNAIASEPKGEHVVTASDFSSLGKVIKRVEKEICKGMWTQRRSWYKWYNVSD